MAENLPTRLQNPGDLKDPTTGAFRQFSSPQEGRAALFNDLTAKMTGTSTTGIGPSSSLIDFSKVYAPASDNNNPLQYAANLANKLGVSPDTQIGSLKGRIDDFADAISGNEGYQGGFNPKPFSQPTGGVSPFMVDTVGSTQAPQAQDQGLGQQLMGRAQDASTAIQKATTGEINPLSGVLQTGGAVAGGINDIVGAGLGLIPGVKQVEGLIGKGVGALAQTAPGQAVMGGVQSFQQAHPELAGDIGAVGNIAATAGLATGAGALKEAVGTGLARAVGKDALSSIAEDVAPSLTAKTAAKTAAKQGLVKTLIKGEIRPVADKATQDIAQTVAESVPNFSKLDTFADKLNAVKDAVYNRAATLKQQVIDTGSDRIYSFKELGSTLRNIERPLLVSSDTSLNNAYDRVIAKAMEIAKQSGGKISDLFDARKNFDQFIAEQFPNLYSSETLTPMRSAVKNIRNGINQFIEDRLPPGSGFRDELLKQSKLFDAAENLAPKAVKEIGTTRFSRYFERHPVQKGLLNFGKRAAIGGAATGLGLEGFHKVFGENP